METATLPVITVKPFIKWAGGKTKLLPELVSRMPSEFGTYHEPFLGGGALFFHLRPESAVLNDVNLTLINTYREIKWDVEGLIERLKDDFSDFSSEKYYAVRAEFNAGRADGSIRPEIEAAMLLYLNRICFNGLYRENGKGEFNVPRGEYVAPQYDFYNLRKVSGVLNTCGVELTSKEYDFSVGVDRGDFVYLDPPYAPITTTSFTKYTAKDFDQKELKSYCDRLTGMGVKWMQSNSSATLIKELYSKYNIETVYAPRSVNSKGGERGKVAEVIIRNY